MKDFPEKVDVTFKVLFEDKSLFLETIRAYKELCYLYLLDRQVVLTPENSALHYEILFRDNQRARTALVMLNRMSYVRNFLEKTPHFSVEFISEHPKNERRTNHDLKVVVAHRFFDNWTFGGNKYDLARKMLLMGTGIASLSPFFMNTTHSELIEKAYASGFNSRDIISDNQQNR